MHTLKLAPAKKVRIVEPETRRQLIAQTRNQLARCGFQTAGSENLDRQFGLGNQPIQGRTMETTTEHPGECQICETPITDAFVDGVVAGSNCWANLCVACHAKKGIGLGTGRGQLYHLINNTFTKVDG